MDQSCAEADGGGAGGDGTVLSCFKEGHEEDPSAAIHEGRLRRLDLAVNLHPFMFTVFWSFLARLLSVLCIDPRTFHLSPFSTLIFRKFI